MAHGRLLRISCVVLLLWMISSTHAGFQRPAMFGRRNVLTEPLKQQHCDPSTTVHSTPTTTVLASSSSSAIATEESTELLRQDAQQRIRQCARATLFSAVVDAVARIVAIVRHHQQQQNHAFAELEPSYWLLVAAVFWKFGFTTTLSRGARKMEVLRNQVTSSSTTTSTSVLWETIGQIYQRTGRLWRSASILLTLQSILSLGGL